MINKEGYDRIEFLRGLVNDGEEAKAVLKFISRYREQIEKETLDFLKGAESDKQAEAISDYRAVVRFCDMLEKVVALGERKEKSLVTALKNLNNGG